MISVALASYNGAKFVCEQLDSILAQTYQDFEVIVCDDCSTDDTWNIIEEYAQRDTRIKVFRNDANLGFKKNFEKAIGLCSGDYIALSDQDDIWPKNHLEFLLNNLGDKSISSGNAIMVDKDGNPTGRKLNEVERFCFFQEDKIIYRIIFMGNPIQGASMLMPKSFIEKCLPIPDGVNFHDAWFAACACLDKGINYSFEVITYYRQHGGNVTFFGHNIQRSFLQKLRSRIGFLGHGEATDRFCYVENLSERFGLENKDFEFIFNVFETIKSHKLLRLEDIKQLWRNYHFIRTMKTHKSFLDFIFTLHLKKPNAVES